MSKVVILGLDCATPQLVFEAWRQDLPHLAALMAEGSYGELHSTLPPITVPAWTSMMTSQDPGMLGFYGFRNRGSYDYQSLYFANANYVTAKTLWNYMSRHRRTSLVFGVPQTYPPKPLNGIMVGCFLTPGKDVSYTCPPEIQAELEKVAEGDYLIDVEEFRTENKDWLLEQVYLMTRRRWKAFRHFYAQQSWDFAIIVEMGIDRIHHGFWRFFDRTHRLYEPGTKYENAIHDYYVYLDEEIGKTLSLFDSDTVILVVSDHGAKAMQGAICVNQWLQEKGYLTLKEKPASRTRFKLELVDWSRTRAWGEGGYYSRIFFNVKGREPEGQIPKEEYEEFRDQLKAELEAITDENGVNISTRVFKPEEVYRRTERIPPDLIVYFGDLNWRSAGILGTDSIHLFENDTGPDDANHAENGILIANRRLQPAQGGPAPYSIYDIAPTVLAASGLPVPAEMIGRNLLLP